MKNLTPVYKIGTMLAFNLCSMVACSQHKQESQSSGLHPLKFHKVQIAAESYESVGVFDVDGDGLLDILSGAYWYEGGDFLKRHYIGEVKRYGEYYDDFSTIPMDVNGDDKMDFVTGGWWGDNVRWRENPGDKDKAWIEHVIGTCGHVETTRAWDVDGDGLPEIIPNNPTLPLKCFRLNQTAGKKGNGSFTEYPIAEQQGHGLGFGDVNGDGRGDFIVSDGWLEGPAETWKGKWILHKEFQLGTASVPILVRDVNGDGLNDLIVGHAHDYGLDWYEQKTDPVGKKRNWLRHPIDPFNSQFHALAWEDLDGDNQGELITGKRYRAHNDADPGSYDDIGLYYYKWNGESFTKQIISYGPLGIGKGTGIHFAIADLRKNGRKDIVVAGKDGLYVFFNEGN